MVALLVRLPFLKIKCLLAVECNHCMILHHHGYFHFSVFEQNIILENSNYVNIENLQEQSITVPQVAGNTPLLANNTQHELLL